MYVGSYGAEGFRNGWSIQNSAGKYLCYDSHGFHWGDDPDARLQFVDKGSLEWAITYKEMHRRWPDYGRLVQFGYIKQVAYGWPHRKNPAIYTGRYSIPVWKNGYAIMRFDGKFLSWKLAEGMRLFRGHYFGMKDEERIFFPAKADAEHALYFFQIHGYWPIPSGGIRKGQETRYSR
jgi:hypothetical protein